MRLDEFSAWPFEGLLGREWLATNAIGGFASSTLAGLNTRKYHGLLVAALTPPARRMVLLSRVEETVHAGGQTIGLAVNEYPGAVHPQGHRYLRRFQNDPYPRWIYAADGWIIQKTLCLLRGESTVCLSYRAVEAASELDFEVRPLFALRPIHELMYQWNGRLEAQVPAGAGAGLHRIGPTSRTPEVFFAHDGAFMAEGLWYLSTIYRHEQERGYAGLEDLWSPGVVRWRLTAGQTVHLVCSSEPVDLDRVISEAERQDARPSPVPDQLAAGANTLDAASPLPALVRASAQFIVRTRDGSPLILAGYPWTCASARDALIAMPGVMLATGRLAEARAMLGSLGLAVRDGLVPGTLAESGDGWSYDAADAPLWFAYAVQQYFRYSRDPDAAAEFYPILSAILNAWQRGTHLGIRVDHDGLVRSAAPGAATSWMDARHDEWVITPRQGKTVELNALWHNALHVTADLAIRLGLVARGEELLVRARQMAAAFNARFWNPSANCCFDVVEDHGGDPSVRPNQILAVSLPYPVLDLPRQAAVVEKVIGCLLTPKGVRTLSPHDPRYQGRYSGSPISRDRALHQGSAYPWLLGPLVGAYLRIHGRGAQARARAMEMLQGATDYLRDEGMGQAPQLFDGDAPHAAGGLLASAVSVGELLRCYVEDILDQATPAPPPPVSVTTILDRPKVVHPQ
jgi:predicted glycogen debranching enzyme